MEVTLPIRYRGTGK